jgi:hypothetical protein
MIWGMDNHYQKLRGEKIRFGWNQLNAKPLKWVKWESSNGPKVDTSGSQTYFTIGDGYNHEEETPNLRPSKSRAPDKSRQAV